MKKILIAFLALFLCFVLSSFSFVMIFPFAKMTETNNTPSLSSQKLYALIDEIENYDTVCTKNQNDIVNKLAGILASNIHVDYNETAQKINDDTTEIIVTAHIIDTDKINFKHTLEFEFDTYHEYLPKLTEDILQRIYNLSENYSLYTKEYPITVYFSSSDYPLNQRAELKSYDLDVIKNDCLQAAEIIYSEYLNSSDISTVFFCESIKELEFDNIVNIYNENNPQNQITDEWQRNLFIDYSTQYISNLVIENIVKSNTSADVSQGVISYQVEDGSTTIDKVCNQLLNNYYLNKQPPIVKEAIIEDFGDELLLYSYREDTHLKSKTFSFSYTQDLNEFEINDDFYKNIVNQIYEEFIMFEDIFNKYYPQLSQKYFFAERPYSKTTVISDNTGTSRYRQLDIKVTGTTDCYVKLYSYDTATDTLKELVYVAYIKAGDSLQVFIPEGDYIFKYATGEKWYGDLHMFSDTGQYFAGSDVLSVHEYMMATTIDLGNFESGSIPTYEQTPDLF